MKRNEIRRLMMIALYQHELLGVDIFTYLLDEEVDLEDEFVKAISTVILDSEDLLIEELNSKLNDWTFDRLGKVERAILLMGTAEIRSKVNDKAVAINEAVNLAKEYCDDESYKLINATLDKL